ncbi:septation protein A [Roseobacter sp. HKCCD9010]|uniref:inner membrane-spanning protein YciB n=1 Tax=unclassified Roseobacter TaxID=196798 RepID=UPI0014923A6F|nr:MULTISPECIES: inner membrane-spanning protein YciB [unclassified Roseobacter]MBF9049362.1 septation protein A [Rhodobacterales bacterium HKCCD4356]NNV11362.1 septation protein A [Roseobacter sp. HKCCD7357]NNV15546.1 septation protein A [Roseobacter sp. HKCCD8768]NNV25006.1 septation protein A [Roseobacter sp. HKCCD8192]NNV29263.1 septation protein A [Roseobacter sp. HKCCD9061]
MAERDIKPWLKSALELGPPLLFFVAYMRFRDVTWEIGGTEYDGFILVTAAFVPLLLASIAALWMLTRKISRIQVFTAILVVVFGALTIWFNDERFFKMKTTLVYGFFAVVLGIGLLRGQSWLQFVMGDLLPMRDEGWMILTKRLAGAFALMGLANEIVWRTQSTEFWVTFETFGLPAFLFVVFMTQARLIERFSLSDEEPGEGDAG